MEAISHAGTCLGVLSSEGIVLAAENKNTSKLLEESSQSEKIYKLDRYVCTDDGSDATCSHIWHSVHARLHNRWLPLIVFMGVRSNIACSVAGITADANILINNARLSAQRHLLTYQESIPVEQLVQQLCDLKQGYTQYGGVC